jgi:hypothetical protein
VIKTVIKVVIALLVLNAIFRAGLVAWDYYELRDEAQQQIIFGTGTSANDLHNRILVKAMELEVPLVSENLVVRRDGQRTFVEARYTAPVEYFPNQFYPAELSFAVDAFAAQPMTADDAVR